MFVCAWALAVQTHTHERAFTNTKEYYCHINIKHKKERLYVNRKLAAIEPPIQSAALIQSFLFMSYSVTLIISCRMRWSNAYVRV
jgi:hypothetical protein